MIPIIHKEIEVLNNVIPTTEMICFLIELIHNQRERPFFVRTNHLDIDLAIGTGHSYKTTI